MHKEGRTSLGASGQHKTGPTADPEGGKGSASTVLLRVGGGRKLPSGEGQPHSPVLEQRQLSQRAGMLPLPPPHAAASICTSSRAPRSLANATEQEDNRAGGPGWVLGAPVVATFFPPGSLERGSWSPLWDPSSREGEAHLQALCATTVNTHAQAWAGSRYAGRHACLC